MLMGGGTKKRHSITPHFPEHRRNQWGGIFVVLKTCSQSATRTRPSDLVCLRFSNKHFCSRAQFDI